MPSNRGLCLGTRFLCGSFLLGPGLGPWPLQCMHKSVVHAQACCACTRILCMHKDRDIFISFPIYFLVRLGTSFVDTVLV